MIVDTTLPWRHGRGYDPARCAHGWPLSGPSSRSRAALKRARCRSPAPTARDRVAVPFWDGILSALAAVAIGVGGAAGRRARDRHRARRWRPAHAPNVRARAGSPLTALGRRLLRRHGAVRVAPPAARHVAQPFRPLARARRARAAGSACWRCSLVRIGTALAARADPPDQARPSRLRALQRAGRAGPLLTALDVGAQRAACWSLLGPLVEELVFRGLLFGALAPRIGVAARPRWSARCCSGWPTATRCSSRRWRRWASSTRCSTRAPAT